MCYYRGMKNIKLLLWLALILGAALFSCSNKNKMVRFHDGDTSYCLNSQFDSQKMWSLSGKIVNVYEDGYCSTAGGYGFMQTEAMAMAINALSLSGNAYDENCMVLSYIPESARTYMANIDFSNMNEDDMYKYQLTLNDLIWEYLVILRVDRSNSSWEDTLAFWEKDFPVKQLIGQYKNSSWYFLTAQNIKEGFSEIDYSNAKNLLEDIENLRGNMVLFPPYVKRPKKEESVSGNLKEFSTLDLDGTKIDQTIFANHTITMINIWATFCLPCIEEMPFLAELSSKMPEGTQLISICMDLNGNEQKALKIIEDAKVYFPVLYPSKEMQKSLLNSIQGVPTTIMVNSKGELVGSVQVGAPGRTQDEIVPRYLIMVERCLESLSKSKR